MLIHVFSEYDFDGRLLHYIGEEYDGPFAMCGGGPSDAQNNAANSQANLTNQLSQTANRQEQFFEDSQKLARPFFQSRMENGLPYYNNLVDSASGLTAQAFAPARAQMERRLGGQGLPNGFAEGARNDFNERQGQAFDQQLLGAQQENEQAKRFGAGGITQQQQLANPMGYYSGAMQGNSSIMNAPLQSAPMGGLGGLFGGLASGAMSMF